MSILFAHHSTVLDREACFVLFLFTMGGSTAKIRRTQKKRLVMCCPNNSKVQCCASLTLDSVRVVRAIYLGISYMSRNVSTLFLFLL